MKRALVTPQHSSKAQRIPGGVLHWGALMVVPGHPPDPRPGGRLAGKGLVFDGQPAPRTVKPYAQRMDVGAVTQSSAPLGEIELTVDATEVRVTFSASGVSSTAPGAAVVVALAVDGVEVPGTATPVVGASPVVLVHDLGARPAGSLITATLACDPAAGVTLGGYGLGVVPT